MDISAWLQVPLGHRPRLRTTLLGEAQVGAGQSVDARLCTLTLICDAISDTPIVSLGMVNWVPSALRLGYAGGSPEVVPHLTWPIAKTLAVAILNQFH